MPKNKISFVYLLSYNSLARLSIEVFLLILLVAVKKLLHLHVSRMLLNMICICYSKVVKSVIS